MKYVEGQFQLACLRAQWWHALVTSGGYKERKTQVGCGRNEDGTIQFRDCTDEEKLRDALATMQRHIEFAQSCLEHIGESEVSP